MKTYSKKQLLKLIDKSLDDTNKYRLVDVFFNMADNSGEKKLDFIWDGEALEFRCGPEGGGY